MKYEVQDAILKVRSTKYEVQGAKYEVLSTRYDVRGAECDDIGLGGLSYATEIQEGPRYGMHWQVRIPSLGSFLYKNLFYIMNIIKTAIEGVVILEPRVFTDARGYFFESYSKRG